MQEEVDRIQKSEQDDAKKRAVDAFKVATMIDVLNDMECQSNCGCKDSPCGCKLVTHQVEVHEEEIT